MVDMSRHMDRILEIDPERRLARVEPGVVLDDLRRAAERLGLTFGPDPATHAWCTLGGMIGNNSCGTHGLYAGKTSDNVESLRIVAGGGEELDGRRLRAGRSRGGHGRRRPAQPAAGRPAGPRPPLRGAGQGAVPRDPRRVSGFNLDELAPERGFHVARSLVGTESTCAFTTEATLRLVTSPPERCLVALGLPRHLLGCGGRAQSCWGTHCSPWRASTARLWTRWRLHGLNRAGVALLPEGNGWLLAELGGDSPEEAASLASDFVASLPGGVSSRRWPITLSRAASGPCGSRAWGPRRSALTATTTMRAGRTAPSLQPGSPNTCGASRHCGRSMVIRALGTVILAKAAYTLATTSTCVAPRGCAATAHM